jgi:2-methylcitrate dehydratase PrpD
MAIATELARRIGAFSYETLPAIAVDNAKVAILDTLGVTMAGSVQEAPRIVARLPGMLDSGPSLVFGLARRASALNAALINGVSAHVMDFDDVNMALGGHPSAAILPGLFALAEMQNASGRDLITAFVAGFETLTRVARGVNYHHYEHGWHPTATLGVIGATAACARLLALDTDATARALAISISLACGVKANFGTMTKPLHVGHCTRNGVFAALAAREGFTANTESFEHRQGFLEVFNGAGHYDAAKMLEGWADPLDIVRPGLGLKLYPCCGSTHAPIDVSLALKRKHDVRADAIERIDIKMHPRRMPHTNRPSPQSDLEAKFSVQYCIARAFVDGKVVVENFEAAAFRDAPVQALLPRIHVIPYTDYVGAPDHYATEMTVTLRSAEKHFLRIERPRGRVPEEPADPDAIRDKFIGCATRLLTAPASRSLYDKLLQLERAACVRELSETVAAAGR